jgi:signal transduction histidine kinase
VYNTGKPISQRGFYVDLTRQQLESLLHLAQKGRNVNSVTHDVNNLLGAIMAYAELIEMDSDDSEVNRMLREIVTAVEKGSAILGALTMIARPQRSEKLAVCDIKKVLKSLELLFTYEFKLNLVEFKSVIDNEVHSAKIPEPVLQRSLMYVLVNALEAFDGEEEGKGITLHVSLQNGHVRITVQDSNNAPTADAIDHMFDPGFTTKGSDHLGMGLTIARELLDEYNGTLNYTPDSGFTVLVPRAD